MGLNSYLKSIQLPWAATESRADGNSAFLGFGGRSKERLAEDFDVPGGSGLAPNDPPLGDLCLELQGCQLNPDIFLYKTVRNQINNFNLLQKNIHEKMILKTAVKTNFRKLFGMKKNNLTILLKNLWILNIHRFFLIFLIFFCQKWIAKKITTQCIKI